MSKVIYKVFGDPIDYEMEKKITCYDKDNRIIFDDNFYAPAVPKEDGLYITLGPSKETIKLPSFQQCEPKDIKE